MRAQKYVRSETFYLDETYRPNEPTEPEEALIQW